MVTVASTAFSENPKGKVKRCFKAERKKIEVSIPNAIKQYNQYMGGTDRMDQNVNTYIISIRGKKWWWSLFTWLLDVTIQNAWQLGRIKNPKLTQIDFRRNLAMAYVKRYSTPAITKTKSTKRPGFSDIRYDTIGHYVQPIEKKRRCANCPSIIRIECSKCDIGLCLKYFRSYHEE